MQASLTELQGDDVDVCVLAGGKLAETLTTPCYISGNGVYAQNLWITLWINRKIALLSLVK
jgi:hypothetical protein